jgi:hypothetical protein
MTTSLNAIPLPNDLQWLDEFAPRVIQQLKTTLDTAPHITAISRSTGIPVTLKSWDEGAFVTRSTVLLLQNAADQPGLSMPLVLRGASFQVMFRHHDGQAFSAEPVEDIANPGDDDLHRISLNLITV